MRASSRARTTAAASGHEEVGLAYPAADRVGRKTAAQDERDAVSHRQERLLIALGSVLRVRWVTVSASG